MTATTYNATMAPAAVAAATSNKGFWTRVLERIVEARMRQVEREIRMHLSYMPAETLEHYKNLPFMK